MLNLNRDKGKSEKEDQYLGSKEYSNYRERF